ncbi:RNA polymerase sigma factor YlaC [bacterium BMS3Abin02]|nr:RNA polymerase sigma factor YlaC [bacterium BMS3Abin02]
MLEKFYRDHAQAIYAYLVSQCRDPVWAEDLMQDTFVRATRALGGFQGGSPRAWLLAIARTTFLDDVRRRSRHPMDGELTDVAVFDPDIAQQITVRAVLANLPETQRSALVLRDQLGLSYEEVAGVLGKSLGATKLIIHRARAAFRTAFEKEA